LAEEIVAIVWKPLFSFYRVSMLNDMQKYIDILLLPG